MLGPKGLEGGSFTTPPGWPAPTGTGNVGTLVPAGVWLVWGRALGAMLCGPDTGGADAALANYSEPPSLEQPLRSALRELMRG